jgi:tetratricopeptide (TPR) repeat protein
MAANQQARQSGPAAPNKAVLVGAGFIAGLVVGMVIMNFVGPSGSTGGSGAPAPITGGQQPGPDRVKLSRDIAQLEEIVRKDPGNYQAWVQIGNDYFDIGEAKKSVDAYQKALAIKGDDPNVLTDMGVMYRQLKDFQKALAAFRKAAAVSPTHPQSRLNIGVVLLHDLNDPKAAITAWEEFLRVAPNDPNAENIRRTIAEMQAGGGPGAGASGGAAPGGVDLDKAARDLAAQSNAPAAK